MPKPNKGFTLIELMIVIAILGIIATIALPAYVGYIKTARMSEASNSLAALRLAEEEYFLENNTYFDGTDTATVESNSAGLWKAAKGSNGLINFNYVVTKPTSSTWAATATGDRVGTSTLNETLSASSN